MSASVGDDRGVSVGYLSANQLTHYPMVSVRIVRRPEVSRVTERKRDSLAADSWLRADDASHRGIENPSMCNHEMASDATPDDPLERSCCPTVE